MSQDDKCYACGRRFHKNGWGRPFFRAKAITLDGQRIFVGNDCHRKIVAAGQDGYQPPLGGPRLWDEYQAPAEALKAAGITITYGSSR